MSGRGRVKRQQVDTDDGWTVITHGLSNLSVGNKKGKGKAQRHNAAQAGSMPTAIVEGLTAEKLLQDFHNRTEKWQATACAQHLKSVLAKKKWHLKEATCIGIGSFSRDWEHRHRAMWQLVLFKSVISYCKPLVRNRLFSHKKANNKPSKRGKVGDKTLCPRTSLHPPRPRIPLPPLYPHLCRRYRDTHHAAILRF